HALSLEDRDLMRCPDSDRSHQLGTGKEGYKRRRAWNRRSQSLLTSAPRAREREHPNPAKELFLSGHEHNYDDVRGEGFFGQTRRERRAYASGVCKERATKSGRKRTAARTVAPNLACGCVARRSQIHFGICFLLPPCHRPNSAQRKSS